MKKRLRGRKSWIGMVAGILILSVSVLCATQAPANDRNGPIPNHLVREAIRGLQLAPVPLDLRDKDLLLLGLGSYIVNAQSGCSGCHTSPEFAPGGNPFMGEPEQINTQNYLAGGRAFGPFTSRNLTPDEMGLPAGLTLREFVRTMRTGEDLKGVHPQISPLLQVMPWPEYRKMTDGDLRAIYEYLRSIPPAEPAAG